MLKENKTTTVKRERVRKFKGSINMCTADISDYERMPLSEGLKKAFENADWWVVLDKKAEKCVMEDREPKSTSCIKGAEQNVSEGSSIDKVNGIGDGKWDS